MELHLKITGVLLIVLALMHVIFPWYFDWKNDLKAASLINRQLMYIHTLFIGIAVFMMGLLCLTSAAALIRTDLGHMVVLGFFIFWVMRLLVQFFGYSTELWRGKRWETGIHILFIILWTYFSAVFFMTYLKPIVNGSQG